MYKKGDFHIHTNYSDGRYTPAEIINLTKKAHIDIIAITDHDTVAGIKDAIKWGMENNIKVIPGIEMSTTCNGESIHVIGYFRDEAHISLEFRNYLEKRHTERLQRAEEIINRLEKYFEIRLNKEKLLKETKGIIARPHIARAIQEAGYNFDWTYIFNHILSEDSAAYVPNKKLHTKDALNMLETMGAFKVLAHPVLIKMNDIEELLSFGFDGIEAVYHMNTPEDTKRYTELANQYHLIVTAGSDFHGISSTDHSHSDEIGSVYLSENQIEAFLKALNKKGV